jgi:FAD:protein FMN transferase
VLPIRMLALLVLVVTCALLGAASPATANPATANPGAANPGAGNAAAVAPEAAKAPPPGSPAAGAEAPERRPRGAAGPGRIVRQSRPAFGTVVEIMASVATDDELRTAGPFGAAFEEIQRIEVLVDEDNPRSPIFRINQNAGGDAVVVEPELFHVLSELQRLAKLTRGAFDLTAGVYDVAWRFESTAAPTEDPEAGVDTAVAHPPVPKKADIDKVRALVGFDVLVLDPAGRTARLANKGARLGVRSVARGYALERAVAILESGGLEHFVVAAGGDLVVRGRKGDRPWMVGVQDPRAAGHFAALAAENGAVMTTADYEEFFFDGGIRYHNVLDPRTGLPATRSRSVTVVGKDALTAEAMSRAVFVLGAKDGVALVERLKGVEAIVVTHDNKVVLSKGLKSALQMRPPTDGP